MCNTANEGEMPEYLRRVKVQMPVHKTEGHPDRKAKFKFLPAKDVRRALGVDYGRKHIGVAVSTMGWAPRPLQFIRGGGIVELMRMAQDVVDVAMEERALHLFGFFFSLRHHHHDTSLSLYVLILQNVMPLSLDCQ